MHKGTKEILRSCGFGDSVDAVECGFCPICKKPISTNEFTSELSKKEYKISGMCQKCQNEIFGTENSFS